MPANFTSGWFGNGEQAWHRQGVVTDNTLSARAAFETAEALYRVEKRELQLPTVDFERGYVYKPSGTFGVVRTDTQTLLGVVTKQYEIVQNDSLLRMAEFIREEADMDCVVVLAGGAKVAFTASLKGAAQDIVPGDTVKRRLVGYLGHDGKTGCGAKFTDIRVVCQNTLAAALGDSGAHSSIRHKGGANANFDALIRSIDTARQSFDRQCDLMREFSRATCGPTDFNAFIDDVYNVEEGDTKFDKKRQKLERLFLYGRGQDMAPRSLWSAVNAVTEMETSTLGKTAAGEKRMFARANFGAGKDLSRKAMQVAELMLTTA